MPPLVVAGSAHPKLATELAARLGTQVAARIGERFPDGEWRVRLGDDVRGRDVFLVQPLCLPVGDHLLELLLLADACRRSGAARVCALVPYLAYARQDRRGGEGEPLGARVIASLLSEAVDRAVVVDLHSPAVEGGFSISVEQVDPMTALAAHVGPGAGDVVVAPDLGAARRAERFARALGKPVAIVHKTRLTGSEVEARGVVGDVRGLVPILVDDIISTAGTIEAATLALREAGAADGLTVCATHGLFVGPARERLSRLPLRRLIVTDSLPPPERDFPVPLEVVPLAPVLAPLVERMHAELR